MVAWALIGGDGKLRRGQGAVPGLVKSFSEAEAICLRAPGWPPIYALGGIDLMWAVELVVSGSARKETRYWGLGMVAPARLWVSPDGNVVGIGTELEDVEKAILLISGGA